MAFRTIRNNCRKEPVKIVPVEIQVIVSKIPNEFPKVCDGMIGNTYKAIVHTDRQGKTWYKIPKNLVFKEPKGPKDVFLLKEDEPHKISFKARKYIDLPEEYCN